MILKFGTQVKDVKSDFFLGQDLFWWLQNGGSKRPCGPWVLSDWEEMGS
jgi:hypothetical protein